MSSPVALAGEIEPQHHSVAAGPFCGRMLADFGAEVIKIEPADGDPVRTMGKHFGGKSLYAASIFRNKRLISVDLRRPEGRDIARASRLLRRGRGEFQARHARRMGARLERSLARQPAPGDGAHLRVLGRMGLTRRGPATASSARR